MKEQEIRDQFQIIRTSLEEQAGSGETEEFRAKMLPPLRAGLTILEQFVVDLHRLATPPSGEV